ncbi:MAG TPA: hypothetical protein VEY10_13525 [Flavisolibacter sp.]|jgi:hypothetical protein|nr:hypothetical protein [Flavisolibacter sp.]
MKNFPILIDALNKFVYNTYPIQSGNLNHAGRMDTAIPVLFFNGYPATELVR